MKTVIESDRITFIPETKVEQLALVVVSNTADGQPGMDRKFASDGSLLWVEYRWIKDVLAN